MEEVDEDKMLVEDQNKYQNITKLNLILADRKNRIDELKKVIERKGEMIKDQTTRKLQETQTHKRALEEKEEQIIQLQSNIDRLQVTNKSSKAELEIKHKQEIEDLRKQREQELRGIKQE